MFYRRKQLELFNYPVPTKSIKTLKQYIFSMFDVDLSSLDSYVMEMELKMLVNSLQRPQVRNLKSAFQLMSYTF